MRTAVRRTFATVSALGLVAVGMVVIGPATSAPPEPTGTLVYAANVGDGEFALQLHTLDVATGTDTALPGTRKYSTEGSTQVSPDGTKVAVRSTNPMDFGDSLDVYDLASHTWTGLTHATDAGIGEPSWLPDSTHLLELEPDPPGGTSTALFVYALDGSRTLVPGTRSSGLSYITSYAVAPSGRQIALSRHVSGVDKVFIMNIDGTSLTTLGATGRVQGWTHDGSRILLSDRLSGSDGKPAGSVLRTITPRGGSPTTLPLTYVPTTLYGASLSPDDSWLVLESQTEQNVMNSTVQVVPLAGGAAPQTVLTSTTTVFGPSYLGAWTATDSTAPTMTPVTVTLGASGAAFTWPLIRTADVVGVQVALSPGLTAPATYAAGTKRVTVLGATRSASFTGLTMGATYSWSAWALDGAGNLSTPVTGHLRLVPAGRVTAPPFASSVSSVGVPVTYASGGGGTVGMKIGATYSLTGVPAPNGYGPGFDVPGTAGTFTFTPSVYLADGWVMSFRAGAVDAYGNVRWSTAYASSVVPYDDRNPYVGLVGTWTRPATTGAWLGTTSVTGSGGTASLRVPAGPRTSHKRFTVVATTSPTGGLVKAYIDGRYVTTFSTRGATALRRNVWSSSLLSYGAHRLLLVQVKGSGWFRLDGIGVSPR